MGKRIRRYLAWALSLVLLLGSGLGGVIGVVAFAADEEAAVVLTGAPA